MNKKNIPIFLRILVIVFAVILFYPLAMGTAFGGAEEQAADSVYLPQVYNGFSGVGINPTPLPGNSVVAGLVVNARTNEPIEGVKICLEDTSLCDTTGEDGTYRLDKVPVGGYTFFASAPSGYEPVSKDAIIQSDSIIPLDFKLLPWLDEGEIRVIVTWDPTLYWYGDDGQKPNDLNLHMWIRTQEDYRVDIENLGDCQKLQDFPHACYESDAQTGAGPDAIVLLENDNDTYTFAVLNYPAGNDGVPPLTALDAVVTIYTSKSAEPIIYYPPASGDGDLWYVFDLEFNEIRSKNCLTYFVQSGDIPPECP